ncbi:MAG TPA: DUF763 domain-containing protein, partial [Thermoplasmata archaeon]|nr:DUF763 domain-containing protein [Thermoplasmata archaeon]
MHRTGTADLPLHGGHAPRWLFQRMVSLARSIVDVMVLERGEDEVLRLMADPLRFQAFACVLGFDWHSSGTTTVVMGALRVALVGHETLAVAGGKGRASRQMPGALVAISDRMELEAAPLLRASRLAAKVDNALVQDSYHLYHHTMVVSADGRWAVVQQGLAPARSWARRYHWLDRPDLDFVEEPHAGIYGIPRDVALDMTARESAGARSIAVDLVNDGLHERRGEFVVRRRGQAILENYSAGSTHIELPARVNWRAVKEAYDLQVEDYETLISVPGIGPATVRALALVSDLVYGTPPSWRDPLKYTFAVGGKDGVPYPVDRRAMEETAAFLREGV